tara:strand:+ start:200 stop:502 length:303 start_codon:yes stop_codon:yes gene_type:complete
MKLRKFQLSCPVFWGYNKYIDVEKYNNIDDIMKYILDSCEEFWKSNNLIDLYEFFKSIKHFYHIHGCNFDSVVNSKEDEVFYICRHDSCNEHMDLTIRNR